jgi:hypothetical protein
MGIVRLFQNVILRCQPLPAGRQGRISVFYLVDSMRSFTEFTLSQKARPFPFASLRVRVTHGEGFRMTKSVFWSFGTVS